MSTLTRDAYAQLIREDLEALNALPKSSLERRHIEDVLNWSIRAAYEGEAKLHTKLAEAEQQNAHLLGVLESANNTANRRGARIRDLEAEVKGLRTALEQMLASAVPHPTEHPTMTAAWENARKSLAAPATAEVKRG